MYLKVLRLDYLFSVLIPVFFAIYINDLPILNYIKLIGGWIFIGISGNLLNDIKDQDRDLPFTNNHLKAMFLICLFFGVLLMLDTFIANYLNLVFFLITVILVVLYCLKIKKYPIINKFVLVFSHIILPYLIIKIPVFGNPEFFGEISLLIGVFFFSFASQIIHEISDAEAFTKFSKKISRILILSFSIISIVFFIFTIILFLDIYLIPLVAAPIGIIFLFRIPITPNSTHKKAGILVGNLLLFYIIILVIS